MENVFAGAQNEPISPSNAHGTIDQERTPNALTGIEGKRLTGLKFCTWSKAVIGDRNRGEFEQETSPAQELLKEQKASLEREIGRQLAVARDANEIARSASCAAGDATAEIRPCARTAKAALIIATIALLVSIINCGLSFFEPLDLFVFKLISSQ